MGRRAHAKLQREIGVAGLRGCGCGEDQEKLDGCGWTARLFEHSPYTPLAMSSDGLPIGMQLMAGYGADGVLLCLAGQLERAAPWSARRPQVWAGS